jgi:ribA/ribD-fused uncharacterized protein
LPIYFYSPHHETYGSFSNFSIHGVQLDGHWWPTVEHYFQAQKFAGTEHEDEVRRASTPKRAAEIGRDRKRPLRPDWEQVKDGIMRRAVLKKFETHSVLRELLLSTGDDEIVENAPHDYYWGCGRTGTGRNMLGQILMEIRALLSGRGSP